MKIAHLIRKDFLTVEPYSSINAIKKQLLEHSAIVVKDEDGQFYGVLTEDDIVQNPKTLIIDCLTIKELVDCDESIEETILKMDTAKTDVLPVGENEKFIGLVFKNELYNYISDYNLELENVIKERTAELEEAIATKDLIFSIIAHDLKGPFNVILGFTGLLKDKLRSMDFEKSEKIISGMYAQARNTFNLLEDLLTWARDNSSKIGYNPAFCNISKICNDVIEQIEDSAQMKGITINLFHSQEVYAYADKNMIEVILRNLIMNAIKFTENGGKIDMFSMSEGEFVEITVSDNGTGIDEKLKSKLFKCNLNESKPGTANEKGSGLGLVICKRFVDRHQGEIWIENKTEKGSTFKFTLPIYKEEIHNLQQKEVVKDEK
ncbi:MAG: CBS domain-containing protein [Flavobacteriaceae bacterium]|nr:CBS domain-containing protein [Flavobacteriaceae bacterium]